MRHTAKVFLVAAVSGLLLTLACSASVRAQASPLSATERRESSPAAKFGQIPVQVSASNTVEDTLKQIASQAAVIFTGTVAAVTERPGGAVRVAFVVERGLRGVTSGERYSMLCSAWAGGMERYHVGERALFLLHAPSALGFSSPVGGELGVIPLSGDALVGSVDLRWIATEVRRARPALSPRQAVSPQAAVATPSPAGGDGANKDSGPTSPVLTVRGASLSEQLAASNVTGADVHAIDRDLVLGMLHTWFAAPAQGGAQ